MKFVSRTLIFVILILPLSINNALGETELKNIDIPLSNDTFKAGAKVVTTLCISCHSMKFIKYRNFLDIGFTNAEVDAMRGDKSMNEALVSLMDASSLKASYGRVPPDLSMMAKAHKGGGRYVYSVLTGYYQTAQGNIENKIFKGIRMPDLLGYANADGEGKKQIEQTVLDAVSFLVWAADPHAQKRQTIGYWVMVYLIILTVLMYFLKRRVWGKLDSKQITTPDGNG